MRTKFGGSLINAERLQLLDRVSLHWGPGDFKMKGNLFKMKDDIGERASDNQRTIAGLVLSPPPSTYPLFTSTLLPSIDSCSRSAPKLFDLFVLAPVAVRQLFFLSCQTMNHLPFSPGSFNPVQSYISNRRGKGNLTKKKRMAATIHIEKGHELNRQHGGHVRLIKVLHGIFFFPFFLL